MVFWVQVGGQQHVRGSCCLHLQSVGEGKGDGSRLL